MEGHTLITVLQFVLKPTHWLAGQIGLPDHLPAVELAIGLVFLASCFGLALHGLYAWLRSKRPLPLVAALIAAFGGIVGLLATVTFSHAWLYTLILTIVAADVYWRILTRSGLPAPMRRAGTVWATAALLLCAGTPVLFLVHTWFTERQVTHELQARLTSEETRLMSEEQGRIATAVATLSESPELTSNQFAAGDPLLLATVQRLAVSEQLPYLVLLDKDQKVLARSQPVAAFGDTWPVSLNGIVTGNTNGLALSERGMPLLLSSHGIKFGATEHVYTLVGGIQIDQTFLSGRVQDIKAPLFLNTDQGITALAAPEGNALNALSSQSVDVFLAAHAGKSGSFSLASDTKLYQVQTLPLLTSDGHTVGTLGTAELDTSTNFRLRFDLIIMIGLAVLVLALPAIAWRKREEVAV